MTTNTQYIDRIERSGCGLQICPHPACWEAAKKLNRELQLKSFARLRKRYVTLLSYIF